MTNSVSAVQGGKGSMVWGILMLICGFLAIALPLASGIGIAIVIGWLLLISAVWHLIYAFRASGVGAALWDILLALLYGAAGIIILMYPLRGLALLTLVLAWLLFAEAVVEFLFYFKIQGRARAGWVLVDAIVTLLLAILIRAHWPSSAAWALGTLVGISLIFSGIARIALSSAAPAPAATPAAAT